MEQSLEVRVQNGVPTARVKSHGRRTADDGLRLGGCTAPSRLACAVSGAAGPTKPDGPRPMRSCASSSRIASSVESPAWKESDRIASSSSESLSVKASLLSYGCAGSRELRVRRLKQRLDVVDRHAAQANLSTDAKSPCEC